MDLTRRVAVPVVDTGFVFGPFNGALFLFSFPFFFSFFLNVDCRQSTFFLKKKKKASSFSGPNTNHVRVRGINFS